MMPVDAIVARLAEALGRDFGALAFPADEYVLESVASRNLMRTDLPVVKLRRREETLSFIVAPTNPDARAYKRTKSFDITYFSDDVPDAEQSRIYQRDRAMIDRFVAWLTTFDV